MIRGVTVVAGICACIRTIYSYYSKSKIYPALFHALAVFLKKWAKSKRPKSKTAFPLEIRG
jgi:hypothetical protein